MTKDTSQHLADLREHMAALELDALIVPRADEYLGEYLPAHNERMEWVSGFTGSAGMVIVLQDSAAIFVDGRYTVQVRQQVDESHFEILHLVDEPHLPWLAAQLPDNARVGCDTRTHPWNWYQQALKTLQEKSIALVSLEQNLIDLGWHQKEFQRRRSFAYTVVALDESRVLGCVYIDPTRKEGFDAEVYLWARQSELANGMETELAEAVKAWLAADWPFENPGFPGNGISNEEWEKLPELKR